MDTFRPLASALLALVTATAAHAVQINQTFEGIDFNGSSCGCLPPSPTAAVGNGFVAQTTNTQFRVFDKPTGNVLLDQPLATLFGASTLGIPNIVYDEGAGRWYVSAFNSAANGLFLAVSRDGNPLDGFLPTYNLTNLGPSPDFPHIGYNADAIFISYNDFGTPSGDATVVTIDKAPALTGSLVDYVSNPPPQFRTMPPAQVHGAPPGVEWFVSTDGNDTSGSAIRVTQITNYLGNSPTFTTTLVPVDPYLSATRADQPGGLNTVAIEPNTSFMAVQYRNGQLLASMSSGTPTDPYPEGLYYQIDVSGATPTLLRQGAIHPAAGVAVQDLTVDEDQAGNLGLSWFESSATEFVSMWVGTLDPLGTLTTALAAPGGGFMPDSFRMGNYSSTVLDPSDGLTFWSTNEYIGSDGRTDIWRTRIASFTATPTTVPEPNTWLLLAAGLAGLAVVRHKTS